MRGCSMLADIVGPVASSFALLRRFWPQPVALVLVGIISGDLLLQLAARIGLQNHMAGLACLTLVALAELVVTVAMFQVLRPGLPRIRAALEAAEAGGGDHSQGGGTSRLARMITIA